MEAIKSKFNEFAIWWYTPEEDRQPLTMGRMCSLIEISEAQGKEWVLQLESRGEGGSNREEWLKQTERIAYKGNSKALELLGKAQGFIDAKRTEERIELSADEYYVILREARERVKAAGADGRANGVSGEFSLLSKEVRKDTDEGEAAGDDTVGGVAVPDRSSGSISNVQRPDSCEGEATGDIVVGSGIRPVVESIQR